MDSAGEPSAKRQAIGSPIKTWSSLAGDALKPSTQAAVTHVIHSPLDKASRAVPGSPPGPAGTGDGDGIPQDFQKYVLTKLQERESMEQRLLGRIAKAESEILELKDRAIRLEPLEAHAHDVGVFTRMKHLVTQEQLLVKLEELHAAAQQPQKDLEVVKERIERHMNDLKVLDEGFKRHVEGNFQEVKKAYIELQHVFDHVVKGVAAGGSATIFSSEYPRDELDILRAAKGNVEV